jgi:peptidoglycan/LPS O-acetylase OafA/YrhL
MRFSLDLIVLKLISSRFISIYHYYDIIKSCCPETKARPNLTSVSLELIKKSIKDSKTANFGRDYSLDFLRGLAVFFMIVTHVNTVFFAAGEGVLDVFTWWGATVCFTTFLFVSGAVSGILLKKGKLRAKRLMSRGVKLLGIYYLVALLGILITGGNHDLVSVGGKSFWEIMLGILILDQIPLFIEFILAFALFSFLSAMSLKVLKKVVKKPIVMICGALGIYLVSRVIYPLELNNEILIRVKSLLVGHDRQHTFGVFSYFPVWTIGLVVGYWKPQIKPKKWTWIMSAALGISALLWVGFLLSGISVWNRWPPSAFFMLYGLMFCFAICVLYKFLKPFKLVNSLFIYLGRYTLQYYYYHLIFIFVIAEVLDYPSLGAAETVMLNLLVFIFSTAGVKLEKFFKQRIFVLKK